MKKIRLGLIGDNIAASRAPELHRCCGRLLGVEVRYDLFIPPMLGCSFNEVFDRLQRKRLHGVNVTLPYKEKVVARVQVNDSLTARIGAVNTVHFGPGGPEGFNTDYTGFIAAYRAAFGDANPGRVMLIGAGGVGKAVAFGLVALDATEVIVIDKKASTATDLAHAVKAAGLGRTVVRVGGIAETDATDGVINCTPLGMHGYPGSPTTKEAFSQNGWAFDAVYTPLNTPFRAQAEAAGAAFLSGYELFFHQGVQAFEIFTGKKVDDQGALRSLLDAPPRTDMA